MPAKYLSTSWLKDEKDGDIFHCFYPWAFARGINPTTHMDVRGTCLREKAFGMFEKLPHYWWAQVGKWTKGCGRSQWRLQQCPETSGYRHTPVDLVKMQIFMMQVPSGDWDWEFWMSAQVRWMLLIHGPHYRSRGHATFCISPATVSIIPHHDRP